MIQPFKASFSSDIKSGLEECPVKVMKFNEEWDEIIDSKIPVVIQCSTSWCRPCQILKPLMEKGVVPYAGKVVFYYIDIDKFPDVAE